MLPLEGLQVVTLALNLPGPAACARLRDLGATVRKVEPPTGDPMAAYSPDWYRHLHADIPVLRLDLKSAHDRPTFEALLDGADLLVTAQRPAALERLGLDAESLGRRFPDLCAVRITGHAPPHEDVAGHDLTYLAVHGLVAPGHLPATLFADMAGAERVVSTALAILLQRDRTARGVVATVALEEAAEWLARPRAAGLTRPGALLGGALAGYNLYEASDGWIAVAALEPHFAARLADALDLDRLEAVALSQRFATGTVDHWERWARERDLPLVALRDPPSLPPQDEH